MAAISHVRATRQLEVNQKSEQTRRWWQPFKAKGRPWWFDLHNRQVYHNISLTCQANFMFSECVKVVASPGTYVVRPGKGTRRACGVYIAGLHNERVRVDISLVDVSCRNRGVVAVRLKWSCRCAFAFSYPFHARFFASSKHPQMAPLDGEYTKDGVPAQQRGLRNCFELQIFMHEGLAWFY